MKVGIVSLGCVKNQVDTEEMLSFLKEGGFDFVPDASQAEVLIVNTCGFITSAKEESIDAILEMAELKKTGRCQVLCVTGCLAQRYEQELLDGIPEIDVLTGVSQYPVLPELIRGALKGERASDTTRTKDFNTCGRVLTTPAYSAYVRIAEGCDNRCAYCAIPGIRGGFRSRPLDDILTEMQGLAEKGAREQILIAQDTSRYGQDLKNTSLAGLLGAASAIPGIDWLRVLYCYPDEIDESLIDLMADRPNICRYLDLPLQHASPRLLKRMNRRGDINRTRHLLTYARDRGFALRTTMIVGFPGETQVDVDLLTSFMEEMRFDRLGAFAFSPEEGTPAEKMPGQVPEDVKAGRLEMVMRLQADISLQRNRLRVGSTETLLINRREGGQYIARSQWEAPDSDGIIRLESDNMLKPGDMVKGLITQADTYDLKARMIQGQGGSNESAQ
ncbi:MAG: 30S ribosomal protein S12 methylthiotransferase RimO [Eubacteriales bacterium]|nr:30S ribosomal protein S12 methylthiotransferase RimO [Eubacteriales bacterium]